jgi:uncharacterized delta-60 repeat protein
MSIPSNHTTANTAGSPDLSFGNQSPKDGTVIASSSAGLSRVLSDGSTLTVGLTREGDTNRLAVTKHTPAGEPDTQFGTGYTRLAESAVLMDLIIQPNGKPVLLAALGNAHRAFITRFNAEDGNADLQFGENGIRELDKAVFPVSIKGGLAVQADNKIVAVFSDGSDTFIYQLGVNGEVLNFGNNEPNIWRNSQLDSVLITQEGFVIAGTTKLEDRREAYIVGLTDKGETDRSFGTNGVAALPFDNKQNRQVTALGRGPEGRIAIAGSSYTTPGDKNFVAILLANGQPDPAFNAGKPLEKNADGFRFTSVVVQPDQKIVALARNGNGSVIQLLRFNPDSQPDATFGVDGIANAWRDPNGRPEHGQISLVEWVTFNSTLQSSGIHAGRESFIGRLLSE